MPGMDVITAYSTAIGVVVAAFTIVVTVILNWRDRKQQEAAQTREVLQEVIGICNQFLHVFIQDAPYPIIHTTATISKEFHSRMSKFKKEEVLELQGNKGLLRSICVEGWVTSSQILHMMDMVEELEHKAASHSLRGELLLICSASFLLAGIVAKTCSPESFYCILSQLNLDVCQSDDIQDIMNKLTVDLQDGVSDRFNCDYKNPIKHCLYFIQIAAGAFLQLEDKKLVRFAKVPEGVVKRATLEESKCPTADLKQHISWIEQPVSLANRLSQMEKKLKTLKNDICEYNNLSDLIKSLESECAIVEKNAS